MVTGKKFGENHQGLPQILYGWMHTCWHISEEYNAPSFKNQLTANTGKVNV